MLHIHDSYVFLQAIKCHCFNFTYIIINIILIIIVINSERDSKVARGTCAERQPSQAKENGTLEIKDQAY